MPVRPGSSGAGAWRYGGRLQRWYSEALDGAGEEFGDDRIRAAVERTQSESPRCVLEALLAAVTQFVGAGAQNDDITAMVLRYTR